MPTVIYSEDELRAKCAEWQKILRLQDWIVVPKISRARDMDIQGCDGVCSWQLQKRMASIQILDPIDYPRDILEEHDMELTLVHELLHLHFAPMHEADGDNTVEEQAIEAISRGLVELYRHANGTECCNNKNVQLFGPNEVIRSPFRVCINCGKVYA